MEPRLVLAALVAGCINAPEPPSYDAVAVGDGFSCARVINSDAGEQFSCWGADIPATHPPAGPHEMIQAAGRHACAIDGTRQPVCRGDHGDPSCSRVPISHTVTP